MESLHSLSDTETQLGTQAALCPQYSRNMELALSEVSEMFVRASKGPAE